MTDAARASDPLTDRISVSLGGFLLTTDTEARVDGQGSTGTDVDVERDLGVNDSDRFRIDGYWRFKPRHKVRVMYFDTNRTASRQIESEIEFGGTVFPAGTEVSSRFETTVAELAYEYAFLRRENYELAGTIGVHNLKFDLRLSASGQVLDETASANGPLPVVGLRYVWRINDQFYFDAHGQFFKINFDPYDGRVEDYNASVVWQPFEHFGVGVGYNKFVTRVDVDENQFDGRLRWQYDGARIFLVASF